MTESMLESVNINPCCFTAIMTLHAHGELALLALQTARGALHCVLWKPTTSSNQIVVFQALCFVP